MLKQRNIKYLQKFEINYLFIEDGDLEKISEMQIFSRSNQNEKKKVRVGISGWKGRTQKSKKNI